MLATLLARLGPRVQGRYDELLESLEKHRLERELSVSVRPEVGRGVVRVESRCAATIERGTTPASR